MTAICKNLNIIHLSLLLTIFISIFPFHNLLQSNPSNKESKEIYIQAKRICNHTSDCFRKEIAKFPPEQRKMMESMFPTGNLCENRYTSLEKDPNVNAKPNKKFDVEEFKKCADDMVKLSCDKIIQGHQPKSCEKFNQK